jgi:hypothetical protein
MSGGLYDAELGSGLFKKRIASNRGDKWFFVFGFPKNERSNIDKGEEEALKRLATELLSLTPEALEIAKQKNELIEVDCDAKEKIKSS